MATNVIPFPPLHLNRPHDPEAWRSKPHALWTEQDSLAEARGMVAELSERVAALEEDGPLDEKRRMEWICKKAALDAMWLPILAEREARALGTALSHQGRTFIETAGTA